MSELVAVTVDDRQVEVPKGTGLVEAAQAAGIEIPVFCYEPRLGPPVGACRMCLVEIEGMPKLQAGCTLTVSDGMVIKTSATSAKAAEGQEATLEFILVNHPLDCPVCDKGGECPLQDLTFRHGPGNTRMSFAKLTVDKPIPVSPLIALDRERCILCYRCTRFSEDVSEDGQLIARNRGARTEIATFEDEPYRSPFSGNVVELCPVGALTSTLYRFDARPWDIQNVPTVCTGCAVGCNTSATIREGKVKRILSRNHPEIDRGWLCDKGRFSYPHLRAEDRITTPLRRGKKGLEEISWDDALDEAESMLREADGSIVTAFSGSETTEIAYALGRLLRGGLDAHSAVLPEATSDALAAFRLPLSAIAEAEIVVVVGDDPVVERAPIVDLWIKQARRHGAEVVVCSPIGTEKAALGSAAETCRELATGRSALAKKLRAAERAVLVWSGPGGGGGARIAELAQELGFADKPGCGAFHLPDGRQRARRRPRLGRRSGRGRDQPRADRAARRLGRRGGGQRGRAGARRASEPRDRADDVPRAGSGLGRPDPAVDGLARARRDLDEPRGSRAAPPARRPSAVPRRARLDLEARGSLRRRRTRARRRRLRRGRSRALPRPHTRRSRAARTAACATDVRHTRSGDDARSRRRSPRTPCGCTAIGRSSPGLPSSASPSSASCDRSETSSCRPPTPSRAESRRGDAVIVRSNGTSVELRARVNRKLVDGVVRVADEHAGDLHPSVEVVKS